MEKLKITRRTFLKASAVTGAAAALYSPEMSPLKGLVEAGKPVAQEAEERKVLSGCRICHPNCPVWVHVKNGRAIKVEGDPALGPPPFGKICGRSLASIQWLYSPTRVKYPLKRIGARGKGKWQRISWDQAIEEIAAKIKELVEKYGPETFDLPGRTGRHDMGWIAARVSRTIGTPNNYSGPPCVCRCNYAVLNQCTLGFDSNADTGKSNVIINWGWNVKASTPMSALSLVDASAKGVKIITVDPVYDYGGSVADIWLPIRPGSDPALALALINVIVSEGLYDSDFVKKWTNGPFLARTEENPYKVATGEIKQNLGDLITEADVVQGGSPGRYLFWNAPTKDLKYWDADEISWGGGPSGRSHFAAIVEKYRAGQPPSPKEISPASELPPGIDPALLGTYAVTLKDGTKVECKPVFQHLADVAAKYPPEKAAEICWVRDADKIGEAARMFATTKPASIARSVCVDQHTNSSQLIRALAILRAITGNVENEGGELLASFYPATRQFMPSEYDIAYIDGLAEDVKAKRLGFYEHGIGSGAAKRDLQTLQPFATPNIDFEAVMICASDAWDAVLTGKPYPVKGIVSISSNWLMHDANAKKTYEAIQNSDLHVCSEIIMTPTAELADYVLPAVTWFERYYISGWGTSYSVRGFDKAVEPLWEARHDYEFGAALAKKLGWNQGKLGSKYSAWFPEAKGELWEGNTQREWFDIACRRWLGISLKELLERPAGPPGPAWPGVWTPPGPPPPAYGRHKITGKFNTVTGKVEIFSTLFKKYGYPPIPVYIEPAESPYSTPDVAKDYPLVLTTGRRQPGYFHSEHRQVPWLREITPDPWVMINPDTAEELGIKDGDWVWAESPRGKIMGKAAFAGIHPRIVTYSQHAWWRPEKPAEDDLHGAFEWNAEVLVDDRYVDPECGSQPMKSQLCKVYKASPQDIEKYKPEITLEQLKALMPIEEV